MPALVSWGVDAASLAVFDAVGAYDPTTYPTAAAVEALAARHAARLDGELRDLGVAVDTAHADDTLDEYRELRAHAWDYVARSTMADVFAGSVDRDLERARYFRDEAREALARIRTLPGIMGPARSTGEGAPGLAASPEYDVAYPATGRGPSETTGARLWRGGRL